ncbi:MAG: hypothetical protein A2X67_09155 [Ignavibacteria bacterium GWA2_55_11]|nr:MAG: hypothetical protein A2X67_09155 [Ignavibacteria bacterium GWA2_55_11]OGU47579.1 MAG: hypothetical protein A2X68_05955 [Ignavibacteria bacterium GWC2_56_12]OGU67787.1 MAG: hypothetical protein A3C56_11270 [Ignavibacteria bacterium RIFCSPHIGHO2_02_FULL_56_12]OGU70633.1 MAG: hypothetical protein A3H45_03040 [Ignavibacteria bacterium RIFCSPLOWO2_02_FULL_55_14]OGU73387.1 MAG: hypothetical protein A3G43_04875 [Ignavibacteria bacterium RIFCSPLOWO2_12_FULL_56_21]
MTTRKNLLQWATVGLIGSVSMVGCEGDPVPVSSGSLGSLDFSSYVAIGNSLTAGFTDGSLWERGQRYSFPNLIAQQAQKAGATTSFTQPILKEPGILPYYRLSSFPNVSIDTSTVPSYDWRDPSVYVDPALPIVGYRNLGIPQARVYNPVTGTSDVLDTTNSYTKSGAGGDGNGFHHVVRRNPAGAQAGNPGSVFQQAKGHLPTVITSWMGNNDVLLYAVYGGTVPLTSASTFQSQYTALMDSLLGTGAKVVIATIPNVLSIAYTSTIKWFVPDPANPSKPLLGLYIPLLGTKANGDTVNLGPRDLVLLPASTYLTEGYGLPGGPLFAAYPHAGEPLPGAVILDSIEVANAAAATESYNEVIRSYGAHPRVAVVDVNAEFEKIASGGLVIAGQEFTKDFISGGIFSLDGIHPTAQASGYIANLFIREMNRKWGASIPYVDVLSLPGIVVPLSKRQGLLPLSEFPIGIIRNGMYAIGHEN